MQRRHSAFTLVELLVTISIIVLLIAAAAASLNAAEINSRDGQRISDLATLTKAIDSYQLANRQYPSINQGASCSGIFSTKLSPYLPNTTSFPTDPKPSVSNPSCASYANGYIYYPYSSSLTALNPDSALKDQYIIVAGLEKTPSPETTSILPASSLSGIGSTTDRTPYYMPGPYCGSSC